MYILESIRSDIGKKIADERNARGWYQTMLASKVNALTGKTYNNTIISNWENNSGKHRIDIADLAALAEIFGRSIDYFCGTGRYINGKTAREKMTETKTISLWIPVSEQLPDPGVFVLVSTRQKTGASVVRIGVFSGTNYGWSCGGANKNVVAWMPLPEPYEVK